MRMRSASPLRAKGSPWTIDGCTRIWSRTIRSLVISHIGMLPSARREGEVEVAKQIFRALASGAGESLLCLAPSSPMY